jgi:hypothetical protein
VRIVVTDRARCAVVDVGIALAVALQKNYSDQFKVEGMGSCLGDDETLAAIKAGKSLAEIKALWAPRLAEYAARRKNFLLYR